ncbi:unnamed protein product [Dicrocoelium dendriticum]|nr:unnamed protein product [Dicrocoelium dendriticum]
MEASMDHRSVAASKLRNAEQSTSLEPHSATSPSLSSPTLVERRAKTNCTYENQTVLTTTKIRHHSKRLVKQIPLDLTSSSNKDEAAKHQLLVPVAQISLVETKPPRTSVTYAEIAARVHREAAVASSSIVNTVDANRETN